MVKRRYWGTVCRTWSVDSRGEWRGLHIIRHDLRAIKPISPAVTIVATQQICLNILSTLYEAMPPKQNCLHEQCLHWIIDECKKIAWSEESRFSANHINGTVRRCQFSSTSLCLSE
ncbi:hypothetical protein TNCV_2460601 [Trichonephila clavipes]|nr:hypothetical protein TNCV_2460601 [Trichonephila clavipes]